MFATVIQTKSEFRVYSNYRTNSKVFPLKICSINIIWFRFEEKLIPVLVVFFSILGQS